MAEDERAPRSDAVEVLAAVLIPHARAGAPREEPRLAADGTERAHGRVDAPGHHPHRAIEKLAAGSRSVVTKKMRHAGTRAHPSRRAASFAKYVRMRSAPARRMDVSISIMARV